MTGLSIVIVHYHTPELAAAAVAAVRHDTRLRERAEVIVVDNGCTAAGAEQLRRLDATIITAAGNIGYAGGLNHGLSHSTGTNLVVMNADVLVQPGCIDALQHALRDGAAVAGPAFHWDRGGRMLLPPTERGDVTSQVLAHMSTRSARWATQARRRWRRHARRHWNATSTIESQSLSGALLAFTRELWTAIGPFDQAFRLYFEETEWLERVASRGRPARFVPTARAHHVYNSSARQEAMAETWFAESAAEFGRRHPEPRVSKWLARLDRGTDGPAVQPPAAEVVLRKPTVSIPGGTWVEVSPAAAGYPAAGERLAESSQWSLAADVWEHLAPGCYTLRLVADDGRELSACGFRR